MTIHLPESLQADILAAVRSGRYASIDDAMSEAASLLVQRLKQEQAQQHPARVVSSPGLTPEDIADQELQRRLLAAGIISEIKPPIVDMTPYQNRHAVPIEGEPISETVIRERR
jgi:Arc/MetJ-type ribon-helix-helix transcriptional regulator